MRSGTAAIKSLAAIPSDLVNIAEVSRLGFLTSGGNTNIVVPLREDADAGLAQSRRLEAELLATAGYQKDLAARMSRILKPRVTILTNLGRLAPVSLESFEEEQKRLQKEQAAAAHFQAKRSDLPTRTQADPKPTPPPTVAASQKDLAAPRSGILEPRATILTNSGRLAPVSLEPFEEEQRRLERPQAAIADSQAKRSSLPTRTQAAPKPALPTRAQAAPKPPPPTAREFRGVPITIRDQLKTAATGLGIVFVPISLLRAVFGFEMSGGGGPLAIADVDTLFLDVTTFLVLSLVWTRRRAIGDRLPFVLFVLILATTTATLLGYVVTNYGTLWRLRSLVAVPLWMLVVALSERAETPHQTTVTTSPASAVTWQ